MSHRPAWHIVTGEYPPAPGGISDYTAQVAGGLAGEGHEVIVWTPEPHQGSGASPEIPGVTLRRWKGRWSPADLARLDKALDVYDAPRRLLVQYAPGAWGYKSINLPFCHWMRRRRRRGDEVWTMIHEMYHIRDTPKRWALAAIHWMMLRDVLSASARIFTSSPLLAERLRAYRGGRGCPITPIPIPSNIPTRDATDPAAVADVRRTLTPNGEFLVGHFGTFSPHTRPYMNGWIVPLLTARPDRRIVLIGRHGKTFVEDFIQAHPQWAGRITATGGLDGVDVSQTLQACDILVQPYYDGLSTRRTTAMAGLALGMPIVTMRSWNTEPVWENSGAVLLVDTVDQIAPAVETLLADTDARDRLGRSGLTLYEQQFALERTIQTLLTQSSEVTSSASR